MPHDLRLGPWSRSIGTEQQITSSIHIDVSRNGPVGSVAYLNELPAPAETSDDADRRCHARSTGA